MSAVRPSDAAVAADSLAGPVPRLQHETLQERVYQELRAAIRAGRLASLLGTSQMPVREAMRRLIQERTLEMLPNRSTRVPVLSAGHFDELTDIRVVVEGHAAALAASRITSAEYSDLRAANEAMSHAIDRGDLFAVNAANERLHFGVYRAARSDVLVGIIDGLWQQGGPYLASLIRGMSTQQALPNLAIVHHFELLAALGKGDAEAARRAISDDIAGSAAWYRNSGLLGSDGG
jgi:DNA-binding GntR family transcriptional regulator